MISICGGNTAISTSISFVSSAPSRNILRKRWRVAESVGLRSSKFTSRTPGNSISRTRSSAESAARSRTFRASASRVCLTATSARSRMIASTSRPTYPTSVNFVASTLTNGASARRARRRAISVLPTPVGPIIRMFFGRISRAISGERRWRRQRLRSAIATAFLARFCPMTYLSSSTTISRGVRAAAGGASVSASPGMKKTMGTKYQRGVERASDPRPPFTCPSIDDCLTRPPGARLDAVMLSGARDPEVEANGGSVRRSFLRRSAPQDPSAPQDDDEGAPVLLELLDRDPVVRVDVDLSGDLQALLRDVLRRHVGPVLQQHAGRGERKPASRADRDHSLVRRDQIAGSGDEQRRRLVGDDEQCLELAEHLVGAPVLRELDRGPLEVPAVLLELRLESREERERVGGRARESGEHLAALEPADLRGGLLHDGRSDGDLAVRGHGDLALVAHTEDGRRVPLFHAGKDTGYGCTGPRPWSRPGAFCSASRRG